MTQRGLTRRTLVTLLGIAALATACADHPTVTGDGPGPSYPRGADQLVLRMDTSGGFVAPQQTLQQMPSFSLYGDGLTITPGAQIEIYPGPTLPSIVATTLTNDGTQALLQDAVDAGLRGNHSYTTMSVSDMPTTTFTFVTDGASYRTSVYGLGAGATTSGMSAAEKQAREKLERFSEELSNLRATLPPGSVGQDHQYLPLGLRVFVQPYDGQGDQMLHEPEIAWPLPQPLATFGRKTSTPGVRCGSVTGKDLAPLLKEARSANQLTRWTSVGDQYSLTFRVLLPDEHGC